MVQEVAATYDFSWVGVEAGCEALREVETWLAPNLAYDMEEAV